ncbi:MAG: phytanoyl-CoA dioxygenase family protein [Planctomycetota bacterium]|nr:phytanoyl-CoA dioxygenase family protein [Planctomycetota bacterium]
MQRTFEEQGFVVLKGFFDARVMNAVRAEAEAIAERVVRRFHAEGALPETYADLPFDRRLVPVYRQLGPHAPALFNQELHTAGFFDFFFHPGLLDLAESFLGHEVRLYPNYYLRPKIPGDDAFRVLWHQDAAYTDSYKAGGDVDVLRTVNCWASLVPARRANGCMQFIPGTHRLGLAPYTKQKHYLEIDRAHLDPHLPRAIDIETDPGDVVLFHNMLFHQGLPNQTETIRWSIDWRYQDATQPTLRPSNGHLARTRGDERAVRSAQDWIARACA